MDPEKLPERCQRVRQSSGLNVFCGGTRQRFSWGPFSITICVICDVLRMHTSGSIVNG